MGEERVGFPSDFFWFFCAAKKKENANEERGVYMVCCSHLQESKGGEKEGLQE